MKKLLIMAGAVAAMAACTKSEVVYDDNDTEIGLAPVNYTTTKADVPGPVENTAYPAEEEFNVFALYTSSPDGTNFNAITDYTTYFKNATFTARDNKVWGGVTPYYWPKTGSLFFSGYSPAYIAQSQESSPTIEYSTTYGSRLTIPNFVQGEYVYTDGGSTPNEYTMVDLMYFDVWPGSNSESNAGTSGYPVVFNHALSWLTFNFDVSGNQLNDLFTITKVTLQNVGTCSTFRSGTGLSDDHKPKWSSTVWPKDIVLYDNSAHDSKGANKLTYVNNAKFKIDDVLVIPQAIPGYDNNTTIKIEFTQKASLNDPEIPQTQTLNLSGGDGTGNDSSQWIINKHYTYNITFTGSEILIAPSVKNWQTVDSDRQY